MEAACLVKGASGMIAEKGGVRVSDIIAKELAAHIGELNKTLIENGLPDVWVAR